jgi:branched-subunit amino acid ABC-type transport system permease component
MIYQQLINGLMLGASYSLIAIGYTLILASSSCSTSPTARYS